MKKSSTKLGKEVLFRLHQYLGKHRFIKLLAKSFGDDEIRQCECGAIQWVDGPTKDTCLFPVNYDPHLLESVFHIRDVFEAIEAHKKLMRKYEPERKSKAG